MLRRILIDTALTFAAISASLWQGPLANHGSERQAEASSAGVEPACRTSRF